MLRQSLLLIPTWRLMNAKPVQRENAADRLQWLKHSKRTTANARLTATDQRLVTRAVMSWRVMIGTGPVGPMGLARLILSEGVWFALALVGLTDTSINR